MGQTATSIHLDSEIKPQFDAICKQIGVSVNSAINIFARAVVREKGFPFPVTITKSGSEKRSARAQLALQERRCHRDIEQCRHRHILYVHLPPERKGHIGFPHRQSREGQGDHHPQRHGIHCRERPVGLGIVDP